MMREAKVLSNNDKLLTSWVLGAMKETVLSMIFGVEMIDKVRSSLKEQLLHVTVKKERNLKNMLMTSKKKKKSHDLLKNI